MNRLLFTLILFSLPVFCLAQSYNTIPKEYRFWVIVGMITILLFVVALVIIFLNWLENRKSNKNKNEQQSPQDKVKKRELYDLRQKLNEKDNTIKSLNNEIETLKKEKIDLQKDKENLERRLTHLRKENEKIKEKIIIQNGNEKRSNNKDETEKYINESDFIYLTPLEGPLVEAGPEHVVYYKAWKKDGKIYFEFVNNDRTKKAINNRTSIIEPFCEKVESSKSPDASEMIATITPGLLNDDYTIIDKAKIEYK